MSWLARIEEACAAFIERAFANMFPSDVEPAQIARKLVATMEAHTHHAENAMMVPSRYAVSVNPSDYERMSLHRNYLEREWAALLVDVADRVGVRFTAGTPHVVLQSLATVVPGAIEIETEDTGGGSRSFVLRVIRGLPADGEYPIAGEMQVGRSPKSDLLLADPSVSRRHAVLHVNGGRVVVRDEGSRNGTYVNGDRIKERALRAGDVVAFGKTELRVEEQ